MKNKPRMERRSKLRKLAQRQLPKRLRAHNAKRQAAALQAKAPNEPRSIQRQRNLQRIEARRNLGKILPEVIDSMKPEITTLAVNAIAQAAA